MGYPKIPKSTKIGNPGGSAITPTQGGWAGTDKKSDDKGGGKK